MGSWCSIGNILHCHLLHQQVLCRYGSAGLLSDYQHIRIDNLDIAQKQEWRVSSNLQDNKQAMGSNCRRDGFVLVRTILDIVDIYRLTRSYGRRFHNSAGNNRHLDADPKNDGILAGFHCGRRSFCCIVFQQRYATHCNSLHYLHNNGNCGIY